MSEKMTLEKLIEKAQAVESVIGSRLSNLSQKAEFVEFGIGRLSAFDAFGIFWRTQPVAKAGGDGNCRP